ncbi:MULTISPECIES: hypothetical protein [unclassified Bartonella]
MVLRPIPMGVIAFCWCGAVLVWRTRDHCHCVRGGVGTGLRAWY